MVFLDFETRSKIDLKKADSWVYAQDVSTEILCLCYARDDEPVILWVPDVFDFSPPAEWLQLVADKEQLFCAHNVFFEWVIYNFILVERFDWPKISPDRWRCTMAAGCALALPRSLDGLSSVLFDSVKKDMDGHKIMLKLSKPRKPSKKNKNPFFCEPESFKKLYNYCAQDVKVLRAVYRKIRELPTRSMQIWQIDQLINKRGVEVDVPAIEGALDILDVVVEEYKKQVINITDGAAGTLGQRDKILDWLAGQGVVMPDLQAGTVDEILENGLSKLNIDTGEIEFFDLPEKAKQLLTIRREAGKTSNTKYKAMLNKADRRTHRVHNLLVFHGASTGRWSGSGIQIQNFPRGDFNFKDEAHKEKLIELIKDRDIDALKNEGAVPDILSSLLRSMLVAKKGHKFVAADYAAIEARVGMWLCSEEQGLEAFRRSEDIYKVMAADIYNVGVNEVSKDQRFFGKQAILGLGYQMGAPKFAQACKKFGVEISESFANVVVKKYRKKYKKVVANWAATERAAIQSVETGQLRQCGRIIFYMSGDFLKCMLPSGRELSYYKPHFVPGKFDPTKKALAYLHTNSQTKKWESTHTYGGKLVENIVQAMSADLLWNATLALESSGWRVVLSVHDELVCEVEDKENNSVEAMENMMCSLPGWAEGLPMKASGWQGKRFRKD